jgi:hypothetical protein
MMLVMIAPRTTTSPFVLWSEVSCGLLHHQRHVIKHSRDVTRGESSTPDTDVRSSEIVQESRRVVAIDRRDGDVDNAACPIESFLESVRTCVVDDHLRRREGGRVSSGGEGTGKGREVPVSNGSYLTSASFGCQQWFQREDRQATAVAEGTCMRILVWWQRWKTSPIRILRNLFESPPLANIPTPHLFEFWREREGREA